eukprot:snap_masked-scaffold_24-processed-gene-5.29-mRNA-1 protein AED:0.00 eAED:0.00 QI:0/-1/0/1/-1/1/1/0/633
MQEKKSKLKGFENSLYIDHTNDYLYGKSLEVPGSALYGKQDQVPKLPVPTLESSIDLYLSSILPLCSPQELRKTKQLANEFKSSIGKTLQERLLEAKAECYKKGTSWFQEYWNNVAYLGYRDSVVYNVSYYLQFKDEEHFAMDPIRRAARFTYHALQFRQQVINATLSPDMKKSTPMSNTQWKFLFNTCRIPEENLDFSRIFAGDVFQHLIVIRKNRIYKTEVVDLDVDQLELVFRQTVQDADGKGTESFPVGILSSSNRDIWAKSRSRLLELNEDSLREIESSAFVVCFDEEKPTSREEVGKCLLFGSGKNRFWDKSFQLVFFENGKAGYIGEHSMTDGLTTTRFVNETLQTLFNDSVQVKIGSNGPAKQPGLLAPIEIKFELSAQNKKDIKLAEEEFEQLIHDKEIKVFMFHGFGKNKVKTFKCSPDAFAQVLIQLAYYKTFGYCRATYESTQTRSFLHGRTEVTRSCSADSLQFSRFMSLSPQEIKKLAAQGVNVPRKSYDLMMKAINSHSQYTKKASSGFGCDRHLSKLKTLLKSGEDDSFFKDPVFSRTSHWALSTSGLVGELMDGWGFGEVVPDGLGIGYAVQNDRLRFTVTSRNNWATQFCANLEACVLEMQELAERFTPRTQSKL